MGTAARIVIGKTCGNAKLFAMTAAGLDMLSAARYRLHAVPAT